MTTESTGFAGLRVAAFESRRCEEMARLIERHGGKAFVSPSMREAPLGDNPRAVEFARDVISGRVEMVILMTGVGFRHLLAEVGGHVDQTEFLAALARTTTIARGPKPVAAMKEFGLVPTHRVHEPNTWREILELLDRDAPVAGLRVAVQEYGKPNDEFTAALQARGALVETIQVYRWEFPEDLGPLEANIGALAAGERDVVLFTSANQLVNVLALAERLGLSDAVRAGLSRAVVASIGPTTSEALRDEGLRIDLEPDHPRMGNLVAAAARGRGVSGSTKSPHRSKGCGQECT